MILKESLFYWIHFLFLNSQTESSLVSFHRCNTGLLPNIPKPNSAKFSLSAQKVFPVLQNVRRVLAERRHGPLLDVSGALWVLLQGLHDLTVVEHEPHELVLPLSFGCSIVNRPDQL